MKKERYSLIVSQIGYRPQDTKRAVIRCDGVAAGVAADRAQLCTASGDTVVYEFPIRDWGEIWGVRFGTVDFSSWRQSGTYYLSIPGLPVRSGAFRIHPDVYLDVLYDTSVGQLEQRKGGKMGWQDCGSDLRAVEGHALQLLGLVDSYEALHDRMADETRQQYREHIRRGAEYLLACQREDGSFMNELYVEQGRRNWTLGMLASVSLARSYEMLGNAAYLNAAKKGWDWGAGTEGYTKGERASDIDNTRKIYGKYPPWLPPPTLRARDKLLLIWAGTELYRHTNDLRYRDRATAEARIVCDRLQVLNDRGSEGIYGFFRVWEDREDYQKGWEHAGWGYGCGAVLPDELTGLFDLIRLFPEDADYPRWLYALRQYAYGYMLPVSGLSPFGIMPLGVFEDRVMFFGPSWHGFNGMYGRYARLAMLCARHLEDMRFQEIALANLQWIMGLNAGVPRDDGTYEGLSWISGIGARSVNAWTGIKGSICNGFCANPQFALTHLDDIEDAPKYVTGEEWIVHNGGFLSGLAEIEKPYTLKVKTQYRGKPVDADVSVRLDEETKYNTGPRGYIRIGGLPAGLKGQVAITWEGIGIHYPIETIAGLTRVIPVDFSDCFSVEMKYEEPRLVLIITHHGKDDAHVAVSLDAIGIHIGQREIETAIQKGGTKTIHIPCQTIAGNRPLWVRAVAAGRFHGAVCECDGKPERKKEKEK